MANLIKIAPQQVTPREVKRTIQDILTQHALLEAKGIDVAVDGGKVTLRGQVHSWMVKHEILRALDHAPSVEAVVDHLGIASSS